MVDDDDLETLRSADQRAIRTVDSLEGDGWHEPSLLPGWTRAHVVAHLALNAEGFARAVGGVQDGEPLPIYDSNEARDADITELAEADPSEIRDRYFGATTRLRHLFGSLTDDQWEMTVNRLPEGPVWPVADLVSGRLREVEIHHADLGLAYGPGDWPAEFANALLDRVIAAQDFSVTADGRSVGSGAAAATGTAADLAWWLIGRGAGDGVTAASGQLPELASWQGPPR